MENMDKELTVHKWVLINRSKMPETKLSNQAQKFGIAMIKGFIGRP